MKSSKPKSATIYKDTAFGIIPRSKVVVLEQQGVKKALHYIVKLSEEKTQITPELIRKVHREGFGFIFPDWAGKFRIIDVTVGEYEPPHYWIHPFKDYNGRVSRLLTNLLALNVGLPIFTIKAETGRDRERYIKAMKTGDKQDYSKLEDLIAKALKESLEKV